LGKVPSSVLPQPVMVAIWIIGFHLFSLCYNNTVARWQKFLPKKSNVKSQRVKNLGKEREKFKFLDLATIINLN
jgi:hypothetical protein